MYADRLNMNIKGLINSNLISNGIKPSDNIKIKDRPIKSDHTEDRDANGQALYFKNKKKQRMTKEQFEKALAILNQKPFMTDMKWRAFGIVENDFFYAEVKSEDGVLIRRMSEFDMWELFEEPAVDENKGQLLRKSA